MRPLALLAAGGASPPTYVEDVFSAYTYTGNGSTQTITNGIDLAGKGGMVWSKSRSIIDGHNAVDTVGGNTNVLVPNQTTAYQNYGTQFSSFNSNGYSLGVGNNLNQNTTTYVGWSFAQAPKFFDVVTWSGDSTAPRAITHSLGQSPGMVIAKIASGSAGPWYVWHRSLTGGNFVVLNTTAAQTTANKENIFGDGVTHVDPTSSAFTVATALNSNGATYVAYLFAHDTATDGLIQCGSVVGGVGGVATVELGWEPQFILVKYSSAVGNWRMFDTARGWVNQSGNTDANLIANSSAAEDTAHSAGHPTATGFYIEGINQGTTAIYLAIRRGPMKLPTVGTQVYNAIARTGTGAAATVTGVGFPPDIGISKCRGGLDWNWQDRIRGALNWFSSDAATNEAADTASVTSFNMDGVTLGADATNACWNTNTLDFIEYFFRRWPGVVDEVCYTGNGGVQTIAHNLTVVPELILAKRRTAGTARAWGVYCTGIANTELLVLNTTAAKATNVSWNNTTPTSTVFSVGATVNTNEDTFGYVAYLFATLAGISKVGSYSGNNSSQTINCGFTTGARFIMIKRTDSTGDWFVYDTTREGGSFPAGNDKHLSLNSNSTETATTDDIDADTSGFIVNQNATTNLNITGGSYIYLAFA